MRIKWFILAVFILVAIGIKPEPPYIEPEKVAAETQIQAPEPISEPEAPIVHVEPEKPAEAPEEPPHDPNGCEPEQYWAEEPPYNCIDKAKTEVASSVAHKAYKPAATNCGQLIQQAGITDPLASELIRRESSCNPAAVNPSSGACGIAQELLEPNQSSQQWAAVNAGYCPKSNCTMQDPVCQLRWMQGYVMQRYGSWAAAIAHHDINNWY